MAPAQWNSFLQHIAQHIAPETYNTWITQMRYKMHDESTLCIEVPSRAFVDVMWPETGSAIYNALYTTFGAHYKLTFAQAEDTSNLRAGQVTVPSSLTGGSAMTHTNAQTRTVRQPEAPKAAPINS